MATQPQWKERWLELKQLRLLLLTAWFILQLTGRFWLPPDLLASPWYAMLVMGLLIGGLIVGGIEVAARKKAGERRRFLLPSFFPQKEMPPQEKKAPPPRW